jgi:hypothetical protein
LSYGKDATVSALFDSLIFKAHIQLVCAYKTIIFIFLQMTRELMQQQLLLMLLMLLSQLLSMLLLLLMMLMLIELFLLLLLLVLSKLLLLLLLLLLQLLDVDVAEVAAADADVVTAA